MYKNIFKYFSPLIVAFVVAFLSLLGYNHYLLDTSLANLKISLKELRKKNLEEVKNIIDILNDAFLAELTKGDFDVAFAIKLEISQQLLETVPPAIEIENKDFVNRMVSATDITFATRISENIYRETQIRDIEYFIKEAITKKAPQKNLLVSKIEDFIIALFPGKRKENEKTLKVKIKNIEKKLSSYRGTQLQEKYLEIAKLYLLVKNWERTKLFLDKSIELDPKNPIALKAQFFLGILYKVKGDFKEAALIFNKIKKDLPKEWRWFSIYQEADCLYKSGEVEKALSLFTELFNQDPNSEIPQLAQFQSGYIYLYDLKDITRAQEAFSKLEERMPKIGISFYIENKIKLDTANEYCRQGFLLLEEGYYSSLVEKYKEALEKFDLALKIISKHGLSYIGKALGNYFLNNIDEAIALGLKAKEYEPKNPDILVNLGFIYYKLEMLDKAIEEYTEAVSINPSSYIYNYNLATLYTLKENYSKAKIFFKKAINISFQYPYSYNNLGYIFWIEGLYNEAKRYLTKAIALNPNYIDAHYNLGVVYYSLGNYEEALEEFLRVEELQPKFRKTQNYLELIKKKLGY